MHLILGNMSMAHLDAESQDTNNHMMGENAQGWAWINEIYVSDHHHSNYRVDTTCWELSIIQALNYALFHT